MNSVLNANLGDPRHVGLIAFRKFIGAPRENFSNPEGVVMFNMRDG